MSIPCLRLNNFKRSYYSAYSMSSSWSDLPLDLLTSIRKKLYNDDLFSFRSVCCQWCSASPVPNPCSDYFILGSVYEKNNINLVMNLKNGTTRSHSMSLPFSSSPPLHNLEQSNGWLVFTNYVNKKLYLFHPVSNRKFIFPPLNSKLLRYYKRVKSIAHVAYYASFGMVVVSSSSNTDIAVAGIVKIVNLEHPTYSVNRFIFCRHAHDDCQRWSLLMDESTGIKDIVLADDGRFYAVGYKCELYVLDERPPLLKLKKIKLWVPKHVLHQPDPENSRPIERPDIICQGIITSGEKNIEIFGYCETSDNRYISLKINVAKLNCYSNKIDAECDVEWRHY